MDLPSSYVQTNGSECRAIASEVLGDAPERKHEIAPATAAIAEVRIHVMRFSGGRLWPAPLIQPSLPQPPELLEVRFEVDRSVPLSGGLRLYGQAELATVRW